MTRAELDRQLTDYTRHAKQTVIVFAVIVFTMAFGSLFALLPTTRDKGWRGFSISFAWFAIFLLSFVVWRWLVHVLAKRHGFTCPRCKHNVLGDPAEHMLTSTGQCFFCGFQMITDATPMA
jgi:hypothetical protein